ncbi:hypothetical protein O7600_20145 [Micromonospora sp. WMMA1998]|uniref:hypothetical protein n=1 Tax=Micromonospora sp. WMMA1998 TaxID=3015167 RepID=UPI00248C3AF3|nr:hypothetical protein [Micromonospora sp. WMMA1998]WBC13443.1 hypothetical protein O7600_20145 [Micromonospora sp. WMMA1998]
MTDRPRRPGEDVIAWAHDTGRIGDASTQAWRDRLAADPAVEQTLASLTPVDLPRLQQLNNQVRRPSAAVLAANATAYARNPLLDEARASNPQLVARALANAPAPTLFPTGDLPAFTAAGIDPQALLNAPWQARHPIAEATTAAAAYKVMDEYGGGEGAAMAAMDLGGHRGNHEYEQRFRNWLGAALTAEEVLAALGWAQGDEARAARRDPAVRYGPDRPAVAFRRGNRIR